MKKAGKSNYQISIHEAAGHLVDLPFCPPSTTQNHPLFPKPYVLQVGGDDIIKAMKLVKIVKLGFHFWKGIPYILYEAATEDLFVLSFSHMMLFQFFGVYVLL